jgi:hypothetical protein
MRLSVGLSALALGIALSATPVLAASLHIGGNGIGGNGGGVLGTGLLGGNSQQSGNTSVTVNANTNTNGAAPGLNLFGGNGDTSTATATLGTGGGNTGSGNVLLDLFGTGHDNGTGQANISLAGLGNGVPGTGGGTDGDVNLDLFGDGSGVTPIGSPEGGGTGGDAGGGVGVGGGAGTQVASLDARAGCFTPNANQLAKLAGRHTYDPAMFSSWTGVTAIKVIRAGLCSAAARDVAAQSNVGELQNYFSGDAALRAKLAQWGHSPSDVIAVDRQGSTLIVYVA